MASRQTTKQPPKDQQAHETKQRASAPHPDDSRKPDDPTDVTKPAWKHALKRTWREFSDDQCTDLAAALTYYAVLALFPALLALVSLLGVVGQGQSTTDALIGIVEDLGPQSAVDTFRGPIEALSQNQTAGFTFVFGLLGALWSASGYVGAFGRAMNRIYEVEEGRPFYKLRPVQLLVTLVGIILIALVAISLVISGPLAGAVAEAMGLGSTATTLFSIVKWPIIIAIVVLIIALLYYATPNVQQPKFRWISMGAGIALVTWVMASLLFGFYVANFGSYNKTYGALAGVIVFLLWLWLTNLALLFGAEFDAETERVRELQAGLHAEETIQLPPRDTKKIDKDAKKDAKLVEEAKELRETGGQTS